MSDPSETSGRPLASIIHQPEASTQSPPLRRKRTTSQSSDERVGDTQSTSSRRRPGRKEASFGPHAGSSRGDSPTMQRSTSPTQMSPEMSSVNYTRTGRISKAKKGLKVHHCDCGRVSCILPRPFSSLFPASQLPGRTRVASPPRRVCCALWASSLCLAFVVSVMYQHSVTDSCLVLYTRRTFEVKPNRDYALARQLTWICSTGVTRRTTPQ